MTPPTSVPASEAPIEVHPLPPFLPAGARLLMLGSFPPPRKRWSMEFYYPNLQNDMWRIVGHIFFADRNHFLLPGGKAFDRERIARFLDERGIALYDAAYRVRRLQGNASDQHLQIVEPADLHALLRRIPHCQAIATTGGKSMQTILRCFALDREPPIGQYVSFSLTDGRAMRLFRMPSTSRAYPLPLEQKAEAYRTLFRSCGLLT
ncbi:MAG: uracil-DNA glycosylase family protein [Bacteroidaceae bacterium]|jgi:G:T/U-mismatch repair DNA glycosylase